MQKRPKRPKNQTSPSLATDRAAIDIDRSLARPGNASPRAWIIAALLAFSIGTVYGPALNVPFIFDDIDTIIRNESITTIQPLFGTKAKPGPLNPPPNIPTAARPLVNLSFALNYQFGQLNPVGYHAVNAAIHFLSAMLLWAIVRRTLCLPHFAGRFAAVASWLALAIALIWALHPLQTEAVIYATQRTELMMALFYLATLYCSLRYWASYDLPLQRTAWLALATIACLAGMASKEVMVSAPLIVLLFDRAFVSGSLVSALRKSWPLYIALAATWILLLGLAAGSPHSSAAGFKLASSVYAWWFTQAKITWLYFKLAIWPNPLLIHYKLPLVTTPLEACLYVVPLLLLGWGTFVLLWRNHPVGFLGTWIFAILSPTFVIPVVTEMAAERRMYLPLAALVVLFVVGGYELARSIAGRRTSGRESASTARPAAIAISALVIAIACGLVGARRLQAYQEPLELWQQVLRSQPQNETAHLAIGKYFDNAGDSASAITHFREAVRLEPQLAQARFNLGVVLIRTNAYNEAAAQFTAGAELSPTDISMSINRALALGLSGRNDEALIAYQSAISLAPDDWTLYNNLGEVLKNLGRHQEAIEAYQQALRLNADALDLYNYIADNYFKMNQPDQAIAALQRGLELATARADRIKMERFTERIRDKH
jgi:Flp pilus assembly protein TadD